MTETLDRNDGRNVKRSAYVSGNKTSQCEVLQSCEPEFNSTGWQKDRSKEYFCSARIFYFVVFRPQSLLDVLES